MKRRLLAMLLLVALVLSAFVPAAAAQPVGAQPLSGDRLVWTVHDQTVAVGTQYVDIRLSFVTPAVTFTQIGVRWDPTYLRLPADTSETNLFPSVAHFPRPLAITTGMPPGMLALQWDHLTGRPAGSGYITLRLELIPETAVAGTVADVWIDTSTINPNNNRGPSGPVGVDDDAGVVRVVDLNPFAMWFDGNGGAPAIQAVVAYVGDSVRFGTLETDPRVVRPVREGYTFLGWSRTPTGAVIPADELWSATTAQAVVFAVWEEGDEQVFPIDMIFRGNGAPDQEVTAFIRPDSTFGTLDTDPVVMTPVHPAGYEFLGWSRGQNDSNIIPDNTVWNSFSPRTVWAQWDDEGEPTPPPYIAIAFYAPNSDQVRQVILADLQADGVTYVLRTPGPVDPNHTDPVNDFVGWYTAGGVALADVQPFTYESPRVFHARWDSETEPFAMWFVGNGGNPAEQVVTAQVGDGVTFGTLQTYPRVVTPRHPSGYAFLGWSTTPDGAVIPAGTIWDLATATEYPIVYAQWDPDDTDPRPEITMHFRGNGAPDQTVLAYIAENATFGTLDTNPVVVRPEHPNGYRFLGWSRGQNDSNIISDNAPWSNAWFTVSYRTVWAQWAPGPDVFPEYVEIAFHGNGGSPARQPILAELNDTSTFFGSLLAQPYAPYRYGYTFRGWYTAPEGGVRLEEGRELTFHGQREFWAQYDSNSIPMWFVGAGGYPANQVVVATIGDATTFGTLRTNPRVVIPRHANGYLFLGWSEQVEGPVIDENTSWTRYSTRIVFAQWDTTRTDPRQTRQMEFVSNNMTPEVQLVTAFIGPGATFGNLDTNPVVMRPTHPLGIRFLGWSETPSGPLNIIPDDADWTGMFTPTRVYARWSLEPEIDPPYIAIGFYGNGGGPDRQVVLAYLYDGAEFFGSLQEEPQDPEHPNELAFLGWHTAITNNTGERLVAGRPITYDDVRIFYAHWERFFLEFRFDGENSNPNERGFDYIRIPVTPGEPIDWTSSADAEYVYAVGDMLSTGTPTVDLVQGWALWGWFDNLGPRATDGRYRPIVGTSGWDLSCLDEFVFDEADFDTLGDGSVISFTAIFSLWGDADDNDEVDAEDVLLMNRWLYDQLLIQLGADPHFQLPINLRAANVTVSGTVDADDVLRMNQWLYDQLLIQLGADPHFFAVLGRP